MDQYTDNLSLPGKSILLPNQPGTITLISPSHRTAAIRGSRRGDHSQCKPSAKYRERRAGCGAALPWRPALPIPSRGNEVAMGTSNCVQDSAPVFDYCFANSGFVDSNGSVTKAANSQTFEEMPYYQVDQDDAIPKCTPGCSLLTDTHPPCKAK